MSNEPDLIMLREHRPGCTECIGGVLEARKIVWIPGDGAHEFVYNVECEACIVWRVANQETEHHEEVAADRLTFAQSR